METYTLLQWLTFFMIYCFAGWIFESTYCSIKERRLLNRGFCHGPWIPLYGAGAVMMLFATEPYRDNLFLVFVSGLIGATALEFVTGYAMYHIFKIRWWDYSHDPLNLGGYICLGSSIAWGFLSIVLTEVLQPVIFDLTQRWPHRVTIGVVTVFCLLFTADVISSFAAAWNIRTRVLHLSRIRAEMAEILATLDGLTDEARERLLNYAGELRVLLGDMKGETLEQLQSRAEEALGQIQDKAGEKIGQLQSQAGETLGQIQDRASEKIGQLQDKAGERIGQFQDRASETVGQFHNRAGETLGQLQNSLRSAAGSLRDSAGQGSKSGETEYPLGISRELAERLALLQKKRLDVLQHMSWWTSSMLRNNPSADSRFAGFTDIKRQIMRKRQELHDRAGDLLDELLKELRE